MAEVHHSDVVVIGGGYAGLTAANRAHQLGLRATVLERGAGETYPCNSRVAGGVVHISYRNPKSPPAELLEAMQTITDGHATPELAQAMASNMTRAVEWLAGEGARFGASGPDGWRQWVLVPVRPSVTALEWNGFGSDVTLRRLAANLAARGGALHTGTSARSLILEAGRCVGVQAERGGAPVEYRAGAVVIADGGFQGNPDLVRQYLSPAPERLKQRSTGTGRGDGLRMAREAGAALAGLDAFYGHVLSRDAMHDDRLWPYPQIDELAAVGVVVDALGRRIADEGMGGVFLSNAIARQPDPLAMTAVFDARIWETAGKASGIPPNPVLTEHGGTLHQAASVRELAAKAGIDADGLERTLAGYNAALAAGTAGALQPARTGTKRKPQPVAEAPYYAVPVCCGLTFTMGGIRTDAQARVQRDGGGVIPGLYAAGSTTGGLEGGPQVGYVGGLAKSLVFGLLAAEDIAGARKAS